MILCQVKIKHQRYELSVLAGRHHMYQNVYCVCVTGDDVCMTPPDCVSGSCYGPVCSHAFAQNEQHSSKCITQFRNQFESF